MEKLKYKTAIMAWHVLAAIVACLYPSAATCAANDDANSIRAELMAQQNAWNAGDVDRFMEGYWKSDQLTFSSGGKTIRGWQATLERYRHRYPDKSAMGELTFSELEVTLLGEGAALVLGQWHLNRDKPIGGNFSLVWRRIDGNWRIIHDHSSALEDQGPTPSAPQ